MKRLPSIVVFLVGVWAGHALIPTAAAQFRSTKSERLLSTDLSGWCDGKEVTVELNDAGTGTSGKHYHPAHSFTYVLDGTETYALDGQQPRTVHAGELLYEPPMRLHTVDNTSPVKLLVIRVAEKGKQATVRVP